LGWHADFVQMRKRGINRCKIFLNHRIPALTISFLNRVP
jgi:hypothetical protein